MAFNTVTQQQDLERDMYKNNCKRKRETILNSNFSETYKIF